MKMNEVKIGIIGLGYVGLPLAVEFGKSFQPLGSTPTNRVSTNSKEAPTPP